MLNAESVLFFLEKFLFIGLLLDDFCFSDMTLNAEFSESVLFFLENDDRFSVFLGAAPSNVLVLMEMKVFMPSSDVVVVGETSAPSNVLVETVKVLT